MELKKSFWGDTDRVKNDKKVTHLESKVTETIQNVKKWRAEVEAHELDSSRVTTEESLTKIQSEAEVVLGDILQLMTTDKIRGKNLLGNLFRNLLVVVKQPPRILNYKKEYSVTLRLLLGQQFCDYFQKIAVQAFCLSSSADKQPSPTSPPQVSSIVALSTSYFEPEVDGLVAKIQFRVTPKMVRGKRKLDQLKSSIDSCQLLFSVVVGLNGEREEMLEAFTSTFPLKVILAEPGGSKGLELEGDGPLQIDTSRLWPNPMEDLIWRDAAGNLNELKVLPDKLPFVKVNEVIQLKFREFTMRGLSKEDLEFIQQKFFSSDFLKNAKTDENFLISYSEFMTPIKIQEAETQKMTTVTYWGWFYHLAKFIQTHMEFHHTERVSALKMSLWSEGYIIGYMTTEQAGELLRDSADKTFLLRFSNSVPSAVTVDWKENNGIYSYRGSASELRLRNIVDRILDTPRWKYFESGLEKESLLLGFTTNSGTPRPSPGQPPSSNGYVIARLRSFLDMPDDEPELERL